ncbi:MAG: hypothetical protein ACBR12_05700 [Microcoleus sp.]
MSIRVSFEILCADIPICYKTLPKLTPRRPETELGVEDIAVAKAVWSLSVVEMSTSTTLSDRNILIALAVAITYTDQWTSPKKRVLNRQDACSTIIMGDV